MGERFKGAPWTEAETSIISEWIEANPEDSPWILAKKLETVLPDRTLRSIDAKIRGIAKKKEKAAAAYTE
jgi:hypothetical protein